MSLKASLFVIPGFSADAALAEPTCPSPLKMTSSIPPSHAQGVTIDAPLILIWDKEGLEHLRHGLRDLRPALDSINIAGGRYGMGTLLTTEWGVGGSVRWESNREIITPETPFEPGTSYRAWSYLYVTIRNDHIENCPRVGGEIDFTTAGIPPSDGNEIRNVDLSALYQGDLMGKGHLHGPITAIRSTLRLITLKDPTIGSTGWVVYEGIPILRKGSISTFDQLEVGDVLDVSFSGGRAAWIEVN